MYIYAVQVYGVVDNMLVSAIVAMTENKVIGYENRLPWHLPADLKYFKKITQGNVILMGRKTYESIGRPLPQRENIVITRDVNFNAPGCVVVNSIETALTKAHDSKEVFVIGGAQVFQAMLPLVQRLYLTQVHAEVQGDVFFPEINWQEWQEVSREDHQADEANQYAFSFLVFDRV